ncbi:MAG: hypothetical protein ACRD06_00660 [Terriglobia bacterium]
MERLAFHAREALPVVKMGRVKKKDEKARPERRKTPISDPDYSRRCRLTGADQFQPAPDEVYAERHQSAMCIRCSRARSLP